MKNRTLKLLSYSYLIVPILIFIGGWIKYQLSIIIIIGLLVCLYGTINQKNDNDEEVIIDKKILYQYLIVIIIICITAGIGNLFYQSSDWDIRNAIFRDLIKYNWPVCYEDNTMLTYYVGIWMVPAMIGKACITILGTEYLEVAFSISNIILLLWVSLGVLLSIIWLIKLVNVREKKDYWKLLFFFLFFSGMDIYGVITLERTEQIVFKHLEWWGGVFQYSSFITQLFWVFNQAVPAWLIMLIFLNEKNVKNYAVLILTALAFSPLEAFGMIPIFICKAVENLVKNTDKKRFFKDVFSFQNVFSVIVLLPMYYLYYFGNSSVSGANGGSIITTVFENDSLDIVLKGILLGIYFYFVEVGVYLLFIKDLHKKDVLYYIVCLALLIIPFFKIGYEYDFCMRASIPYLVIVNYWVVDALFKMKNIDKYKVQYVTLMIVFFIGLFTPGMEYYRAFSNIISQNKINTVYDSRKSIYIEGEEGSTNFVTEDYEHNSSFYKYYVK